MPSAFGSHRWAANGTFPRVLWTCQAGFEPWLKRELGPPADAVVESGAGWVRCGNAGATVAPDWCFAHAAWLEPVEIVGASVNALAARVADVFLATAREERFAAPWPLLCVHADGLEGLGRRTAAVEGAVREVLQRKMGRVAKLATATAPRCGAARGLFVYFADFQRAFVARDAWFSGARRMADDPAAPSRSYLKVEEAYGVLGREPAAGETVVDLGAAPGGWSFSAAQRGAQVIAIDNGPLKGGALNHPHIEHRREDAFKFRPPADGGFDWLFCDLVEEPHHVLHAIVEPWLDGRWCRRFVVNLKFGRTDALALLEETRARLASRTTTLVVRHLFHDREEFTVVGEAR